MPPALIETTEDDSRRVVARYVAALAAGQDASSAAAAATSTSAGDPSSPAEVAAASQKFAEFVLAVADKLPMVFEKADAKDLDCVLTVMALSVSAARATEGDAAASAAAEAAAGVLSSSVTPHPAQRLAALSSLHGASPPGSAGRTAALRGALAVAQGIAAAAAAASSAENNPVASGAAALSAAARAHGEAWASEAAPAASGGEGESIRAELLLSLAEAVRAGAPGKRGAARDASRLAAAALASTSSSPSPCSPAALAAAERAVADFLASPDAASFELASAPAVRGLSESASASGKALAAALDAALKGDAEAAALASDSGAAALASVGVDRSHVEAKARLIALLKAAEAAPGGVLAFADVEEALALPAGGAARALVAAAGSSARSTSAVVVRIDGAAKTAHVARRAPLYPSSQQDYGALAAGLKKWAEHGRAVVEKIKAADAAEASGREA